MRVELRTLLQTRTICHPSRLVSAVFTRGGEFTVTVSGYPWWLAEAPAAGDRLIVFTFAGLREGAFTAEEFFGNDHDDALECFEIVDAADAEWARFESHDVYCVSPLPDPLKLFSKLHDHLVDAGAFRSAERFLNTGETGLLSKFAEICSARSYLVGRAPKGICDLICQELDAQGVKYNMLAHVRTVSGLLVKLGSFQFLCETAEAEFEE